MRAFFIFLELFSLITFRPITCFRIIRIQQHQSTRTISIIRKNVPRTQLSCSKTSNDEDTTYFKGACVRRRLISSLIASTASIMASMGPMKHVDVANAEIANVDPAPTGALSNSEMALRLHNVPTFTIVDKSGAPFFVFGEDAKLTSYFFIEYEEADRILSLAKQSSDKAIADSVAELKEKAIAKNGKLSKLELQTIITEVGTNPWNEARISVIPLDIAVTLASVASSSKSSGVHFQVAPSKQDIEDAIELNKLDDLVEGKVPIFYFEEFDAPLNLLQLKNIKGMEKKPDTLVTPLYFQKAQLISDWLRLHPNTDIPEVQTSDLFATLVKMVKPNASEDEVKDLQKLVFISPKSSERKAKECISKGRDEEPYRLDQRIIVM